MNKKKIDPVLPRHGIAHSVLSSYDIKGVGQRIRDDVVIRGLRGPGPKSSQLIYLNLECASEIVNPLFDCGCREVRKLLSDRLKERTSHAQKTKTQAPD